MNKVIEPKNGHSLDADNAGLIIDLRGAYLHGTIIDLSGCTLKRIKILTELNNQDPEQPKVKPVLALNEPAPVKALRHDWYKSTEDIEEIWTTVEKSNGFIEVSNTGLLRYSNDKSVINRGRRCITIKRKQAGVPNEVYSVNVPREVAKNFLPLPEGFKQEDIEHMYVLLKDKRGGFAVTNLKWSTNKFFSRDVRPCSYQVISYRIGEEPYRYASIQEAARILGIPYTTLHRKLRLEGVYRHTGGVHIRLEDENNNYGDE